MSGCLRSGALQFLGSPSAVLPEPYPQHLTDKQAVSWRLSFYLRNVCRWCEGKLGVALESLQGLRDLT